MRLALLDDRTGPALTAAQNRRGLVVFVSARPVDRPPRGLGRTPGGCLLVVPGRAARPPRGARGRRLPGLRGRAHRRRRRGGGGRRQRGVSARRRAGGTRAGGRVDARGARRARRSPSSRSAASRALQWMQMLEPAAGAARRLRGARRRRRDLRPARSPAGCPGGRAPPRRVLVAVGALALALLGRRRRRRAAAARTAGASWPAGDRPRHLRAARRARALPRPGRVDADRDRARRHRARRRSPRSSRSGRAGASSALRNVALVLLVTLYAVPAVALDLVARSSSAARCWRCSSSPTCGSSGCGSPTPARPAMLARRR